MRNTRHIAILCFGLGLAAAGCRSESFTSGSDKGGSKSGGPERDAQNGEKAPGGPCDLSGDTVRIAFPPDIQKCVDAGRIFDFETHECTDMPSNKECSFEDIMDKASKLKFDVDKLQENLATAARQLPHQDDVTADNLRARAKLVSCGTSPDKRTLVAQWYFPPTSGKDAASCQFSPEMNIMTVCYRMYVTGEEKPPAPKTQAEHVREVSRCLRRL